jgi:acetyl-CoA C-acetyltransferase
MNDVVIVDAVRTPIGKRGGTLSNMNSVDLLGQTLRGLIEKTGVDPMEIGEVIAGCVGQVGMQSYNIARGAWLTAGLPLGVPGITIDAQCGSSQQATNTAFAMVAAGVVDAAIACGVEVMSRIPIGSTIPQDGTFGKPVTKQYWSHFEYTTQFEGAERIADQWGITRQQCDEFGKLSQDRAALAQLHGRFENQIVAVETGSSGSDGELTNSHEPFVKDEGIRETSIEGLSKLRPVGREDGVHTAGTSSQVSDGASAILLMSATRAKELGLRPLATVSSTCLVGSDPVLMLTGPIVATRRILEEQKLTMDDIDVTEINEAFASVVLAWERELKPDMEKVNPNGGAIALGHPLGATGAVLITKAIYELTRNDKELALVTMCCGGGLGTGTLLRRM